MKPTEVWEALADIVTEVTKKPFREEHVTDVEWAIISDKVLRLAEKATGVKSGDRTETTANSNG